MTDSRHKFGKLFTLGINSYETYEQSPVNLNLILNVGNYDRWGV